MRRTVVALIMGLGLLIAGPASALECAPDPAEVHEWAFAKLGPIAVSDGPGTHEPSGAMMTEFSRAYPVIGRQGRRELQLCIEGRAVWSRTSNFITTPGRLWIETGPAMRLTERPSLEFWESPDRLRVYVGGETEIAPPDYREVAGNSVRLPVSFPVIRVNFVKMRAGNRDVEVASVLMPFAREAVEAYDAIRNPDRDAEPDARLGLVVDISGSTEGLVAGPLRELAAALAERPHLARLRVVSAGFGGDGGTDTHKDRALSDPDLALWRVRPAPDGGGGRHAVDAAIGFVRRNGSGKMPLVVLAGGDVVLDPALLAGFPDVVVGQATPELQATLGRSADGAGAEFVAFGPTLGAEIAARVAALIPEPEAPKTDAPAFAIVTGLMEAAGMLPILPADIDARERMAIPPTGRTDAAWFAVELFLVVRSDLLTWREE